MRTLDPFEIRELGMDPDVHRRARPHGIGKRTDMPNWYEDNAPRRHNPILLAVAAEINAVRQPRLARQPRMARQARMTPTPTTDGALATRAMDLARTYFALAMDVLPDGRHHGCAANTVSAVARGHGRENHAGMITAVLAPLI
jgi:hypothetical protein